MEKRVREFLVEGGIAHSERKRNSNPRKLYPADQMFIKAFDASGRANLGHALETVVLNKLERRGAEVGYVKTDAGLEVDFLARHRDAGEELIQVCAPAVVVQPAYEWLLAAPGDD